ncbi:hypothetical protein D3C85_1011850 [compost metagenome]
MKLGSLTRVVRFESPVMRHRLLLARVRLDTLPGAVKAEPTTVDPERLTLARPGLTAGGGAVTGGDCNGGSSPVSSSGKSSGPVSGGSAAASRGKSLSVPTRSHWLAPVAVELVRVMFASPATPIVGPLLLLSELPVKSAVDTALGMPKA